MRINDTEIHGFFVWLPGAIIASIMLASGMDILNELKAAGVTEGAVGAWVLVGVGATYWLVTAIICSIYIGAPIFEALVAILGSIFD